MVRSELVQIHWVDCGASYQNTKFRTFLKILGSCGLTIARELGDNENVGAYPDVGYLSVVKWACGAVGSALPWHGRGRRFEPDQVHQFIRRKIKLSAPDALTSHGADCGKPRADLDRAANKIRKGQIIASQGWHSARLLGMRLIQILAAGIALAFFTGVTLAAPQGRAAPSSSRWVVQLSPTKIVNGEPVLLEVTPPAALQSLTGTWLGHELVFDRAEGTSWFVLAGVSLETKRGSYPIKLEGVTANGGRIQFAQNVTVSTEKYPTVQLKVSKAFTAPDPEQQAKIKADQEVKHQAFSQVSPEREWAGAFAPPVTAAVSDVFGTRRVFNGATKSVHQGLDYRVPPSTPVSAVNRGTVIRRGRFISKAIAL